MARQVLRSTALLSHLRVVVACSFTVAALACADFSTKWKRLNGDVSWATSNCTRGAPSDPTIVAIRVTNRDGLGLAGIRSELSGSRPEAQVLTSNTEGWAWALAEPGAVTVETSLDGYQPTREQLGLAAGTFCQIRVVLAPVVRDLYST